MAYKMPQSQPHPTPLISPPRASVRPNWKGLLTGTPSTLAGQDLRYLLFPLLGHIGDRFQPINLRGTQHLVYNTPHLSFLHCKVDAVSLGEWLKD